MYVLYSGIAKKKTKSNLPPIISRKMGAVRDPKPKAFMLYGNLITEKVIEGCRLYTKAHPLPSPKELGEMDWNIINLIGKGKGINVYNFVSTASPIAKALTMMVKYVSSTGRMSSSQIGTMYSTIAGLESLDDGSQQGDNSQSQENSVSDSDIGSSESEDEVEELSPKIPQTPSTSTRKKRGVSPLTNHRKRSKTGKEERSDEDEDIEIPSTPSYTKRTVKEGKKMMETHPKLPKTPPQKKTQHNATVQSTEEHEVGGDTDSGEYD